jgi:hypothetical protein
MRERTHRARGGFGHHVVNRVFHGGLVRTPFDCGKQPCELCANGFVELVDEACGRSGELRA